ncbi:uncharacterized protein LAJ45_08893 [Morchella importuna]|uniref:uncharacterized protein n=1 Tax=Morchella importuna TaxID=1174673 RepID=UPI001E8CB8DA|nr:uncharacterized protein LAJ45_08893 [Morchella importuna]KAH8147093.1 hypothetical protein LAJ45_08893 [Morchella importuna]
MGFIPSMIPNRALFTVAPSRRAPPQKQNGNPSWSLHDTPPRLSTEPPRSQKKETLGPCEPGTLPFPDGHHHICLSVCRPISREGGREGARENTPPTLGRACGGGGRGRGRMATAVRPIERQGWLAARFYFTYRFYSYMPYMDFFF